MAGSAKTKVPGPAPPPGLTAEPEPPLELGAMVRVNLPGRHPDADVEVRAVVVSRPRELTATITHPGGGCELLRWRLVEVLVEGEGEPCEVAVERIVEEHAEGEAAEVDRASALASAPM